MSDTPERLLDVWIEEADALRDSGFVMPNPEADAEDHTEPVDLHGLTHDQLVFIGLAESRAVDLLKDAKGDPIEAARSIQRPTKAFVDGADTLHAMTVDLFIDPRTGALDRLVQQALAELDMESNHRDYVIQQV